MPSIFSQFALLGSLGGLWVWSIWVCADYWRWDPRYTFGWMVPFLVVFFALKRLRAWRNDPNSRSEPTPAHRLLPFLLVIAGLCIFPLEVTRQENGPTRLFLWVLCSSTVALTLCATRWIGGHSLSRVMTFPFVFFLTAVPWPTRMEYPLTNFLMRGVTETTVIVLRNLKMQVQSFGMTIMMPSGPVGIIEACSGISSIQVTVMMSLALGEWFRLNPRRRVALFSFSVMMALITNVIRTTFLCLVLERYGAAMFDQVHEWVGAITLYVLFATIFFFGKFVLPSNTEKRKHFSASQTPKSFLIPWKELPDFRWFFSLAVLSLLICKVWYWELRQKENPQTAPFFKVRIETGNGVEILPFKRELWRALSPDSGEMLQARAPGLSNKALLCYHLFWKPSPRLFFGVVHQPQRCMPGAGWNLLGKIERVNFAINHKAVCCYGFRFQREGARAYQLWGVFRNGEPVELDEDLLLWHNEKISWVPTSRNLGGIEIISCIMLHEGEIPPVEAMTQAFGKAFQAL